MYLKLNEKYALRGWQKLPCALEDRMTGKVLFFSRKNYDILLKADGKTKIEEELLSEEQKGFLKNMIDHEIVTSLETEAQTGLSDEQEYRLYPAVYMESVQWSITGKCNYKCRHCMVSSPHALLGEPTLEECRNIIDQLRICGVRFYSITGGEPLVRKDFWQIVDYAKSRGLVLNALYTNGSLVTEDFLVDLEKRKMKPVIQMSFDGLGCHDWMRGVKGAEEAVLSAFELCRKHHFKTAAAMALNRQNCKCLRETVKLLSEYGVEFLKVSGLVDAGEWQQNKEADDLSAEETYEVYANYIPYYFEDGLPLNLMLEKAFVGKKGKPEKCSSPFAFKCKKSEKILSVPVCESLKKNFYISPENTVLPCMSFVGSDLEKTFPRILEHPLADILNDSVYSQTVNIRIDKYLRENPDCRDCRYLGYCMAGCRANLVGAETFRYLAKDERTCALYTKGYAEKINEICGKYKQCHFVPPT